MKLGRLDLPQGKLLEGTEKVRKRARGGDEGQVYVKKRPGVAGAQQVVQPDLTGLRINCTVQIIEM